MNSFASGEAMTIEPSGAMTYRRSLCIRPRRRYSSQLNTYLSLMVDFDFRSIGFPDFLMFNGRHVCRKPIVFTTLASVSAARHYFPADDVFEHMFSFLRGSVVVMLAPSLSWTTLDKHVCLALYAERYRLYRKLFMFMVDFTIISRSPVIK